MEWPRPHYKNLWAPWRMKYIKGGAREAGCIFCEAPKMPDDKALIVYRGERAYVILNKYPYNSGHLMVVPYRHAPSIEDLTDEESLELIRLVKVSLRALREAYKPQGFNIGVNIGEVAGAGIAGHVHIHVVPRWAGDTNFMPIIGGVKVIPQSLEDSYREIREAFKSVMG